MFNSPKQQQRDNRKNDFLNLRKEVRERLASLRNMSEVAHVGYIQAYHPKAVDKVRRELKKAGWEVQNAKSGNNDVWNIFAPKKKDRK